MKSIIIKQIHLVNFKGVRDLTIDFNQTITNIYGRNGAGKTTVFDAFTWLLFGKDSQDRKAFDLKTLDEDGNIIAQLPHEVSAVIEVNGQEIALSRRFTEKWVKRAGKVDKEFDGNKEERFFNDVPCSKKDYEEHIAEICDEAVFKFITSPTYFTSQKAEVQKAMLHRMAGNITDEEVAADNEDFQKLLAELTGKTLADFKKEISAKKQRINAELVDLPGRIDEKKRDIAKSEAEDWSSLEEELKSKREARADIEKQLEDINAAEYAKNEAARKIMRDIEALRTERMKRQNEITDNVMRDFYAAQGKKNELTHEIDLLKQKIVSSERDIETNKKEIAQCEARRNTLLEEWKKLNEKQKSIKAETLQIDETQFVCPTCHRPLDVAEIETKEAQMRENFEKEREKRLGEVADDIARNKRNGMANNTRKEEYQKNITIAETDIANSKKRIAAIEVSSEYTAELVRPDASTAIEADSRMKSLQEDIDRLTKEKDAKQQSDGNQNEDREELRNGRTTLTEAIEMLVAKLAKRTDVDADKCRVNELEKKMQELNIELAELERKEFVIAEFSKARSAAIEARINGLFRIVRFRWIAVAINGAESETCEATLNGKPYSTCSNAERINIGLDIINAICKSEDIYAPIIIDNAESINDILPMQSQVINLIVSRDAQLRVEANNQ
jgi:DNA repair exonuclease SbcCD ATPase subunit